LIFFIKKERASPFASRYENNGTEIDPEKRWIRILDDYLQRIKYFFRWLYNRREQELKGIEVAHNQIG
jgi:hypothetical protein